MSFVDVNLSKVVKEQYFFKLKAYSGIWMTMIFLQIIAMILSIRGAISSSSWSINHVNFRVEIYSADMLLIFMVIWVFVSAILITGKENRFADFTFVTNRLSSHLANMMFLLTASILGGVTIHLINIVVKLFVSSLYVSEYVPLVNLHDGLETIFIGMVATMFYLLLFATLGYFVGMLVQWHIGFAVILPSLFIGTFIIDTRKSGDESMLVKIVQFFGMETSLILFAVKVIFVCAGLMAIATVLTNRLEVRR